MRFAIAYSKLDKAGVNIVERLREIGFLPQIPIIELKKETIFSDDISEKKYPQIKQIDFIVFASRHKSKKGNPSLSLHAPGNWRGADYGGKEGKICKTSAFVLKYLFQELNKNAQEQKLEGYEVTMEVTHHGPLIEKPCCFIELGSSEKQWQDKEAAKKGEDTSVVVVQPPVTETPTNWVTAGTVSAPTLPATGEKSLFESTSFLVALVVGEVLLVIIAILLVTAVMRKRSQ